jgi:hypothetical protein
MKSPARISAMGSIPTGWEATYHQRETTSKAETSGLADCGLLLAKKRPLRLA